MASPPGRILRVGIGGGLMTWGACKRLERWRRPLIIAGTVPASAGIFDFCVIFSNCWRPVLGQENQVCKVVLSLIARLSRKFGTVIQGLFNAFKFNSAEVKSNGR